MGMYTNFSGYHSAATDYTEVQPFVGESFNYHELGIMAATEMAANESAFMKGIALSELRALEESGGTDVLYESVNFKGIFDKIKMFFKKIIEKIHKIFHTFVAKMSSWFGSNSSFAKSYEKEVVKKWSNVKSDWEFKGYKYSNVFGDSAASGAEEFKIVIEGAVDSQIKNAVSGSASLETIYNGNALGTKEKVEAEKKKLSKFREDLDNYKEKMRGAIVQDIDSGTGITTTLNLGKPDANTAGISSLDSSEFTDELFKVFRSGEDSKEDIPKDKILEMYGGSISGMMTYIKEFDKIKKKSETTERKLTNAIDKLIKDMDKAQNELIKASKDATGDTKDLVTAKNEYIVQVSAVYQSLYGAASEYLTQAFSAMLQAQKEACTQAKEIAVKVIGQSKKMTESYDYDSDSYANEGFDFISNVKLI
nr:MAG TPA: hypothetical protein [Caudoviricetes sp.]